MNTETNRISTYDVVIVGAGAAGLFAAGRLASKGVKTLLLEHTGKVAQKVRISGGGRCNFTNKNLEHRQAGRHFISANSRFARSALARFTPQDCLLWLDSHGVRYHEKHKGQMFCDDSSQDVISALLRDAQAAQIQCHSRVNAVRLLSKSDSGRRFELEVLRGNDELTQPDCALIHSTFLIVATGGLSIPKIGASDWGYRLAKQFAIPLKATSPGLVPLLWSAQDAAAFEDLSGLSLPVHISTSWAKSKVVFAEDLLFTHQGLSGPAALQISNYWQPGQSVTIDLLNGLSPDQQGLQRHAKTTVMASLAQIMPKRLAKRWVQNHAQVHPEWSRPLAEISNASYQALIESLRNWSIFPVATAGYKKAEVTLGGVCTSALSSQTMECQAQPGLYFIGEVVDVTGWLGGYNFQWAWASAAACAQAVHQAWLHVKPNISSSKLDS